MPSTQNSFGARSILKVGDKSFTIYKLSAVEKAHPAAAKLPFSLKILLECLLRTEDGLAVTADDVKALANWQAKAEPDREIAFAPSRVLLQDFTGVPAVVDLAAMRDAMKRMGGDPKKINPLQPVELVIDHSVQVDEFGTPQALLHNAELEFTRNRERYQFLRWGQTAFDNFRVVPPDQGIVHQVNLEYLARVVFSDGKSALSEPWAAPGAREVAYPDTVVGTDSHTTMINGLGVLGWGVGGIEAEAAMLGQPVSMLIPQVVGMKLTGKLPEGATATDLVLTVTQMLRKKGVVGKFVEFFGAGLAALPLADRATIANMAPEYGATCGIFPVDDETLRYLRASGRTEAQIQLVEAYYKEQGLFHTKDTAQANYSDTLELDLGTVEPSLAGPTRPQDRVTLANVKKSLHDALAKGNVKPATAKVPGTDDVIGHGAVVIAAITSCTNTSNPSVLIAAGLLAKNAVDKGLTTKPWVKTSLAPGSKVVTDYLKEAGLLPYFEKLRFHVAGYGCTTCIGNSGPLPPAVSQAIADVDLTVAAVLSGNRNFEGRVHAEVKANYLASPPLVVAYALAGTTDIDLTKEPLGNGKDGKPVFLKDIWPSRKEVEESVEKYIKQEMYRRVYAEIFAGDEQWAKLEVPAGDLYKWDEKSTYVKHPPYFEGMTATPPAVTDLKGARCLAVLGDSITTDHISPAGSIKEAGPAGKYLVAHSVTKKDFNSYGARRGNHEVMVRGTFANIRLKNMMVPGTEGGVTRHLPSGEQMSIFDASERYEKEGVGCVILGGKEYGSGSSRDWGAKGPKLLGVRAVIAETYERIHRSNLVGMGILPLQFKAGENAQSLGLNGEETFDVAGIADGIASGFGGAKGRELKVTAHKPDGTVKEFTAKVRIDTPQEILYYQHGGILPFVLRQLLGKK
ncbi:MAG TPA: aconitate hydratase AcnA [Polyangiaceae bacterium]|jgi:aconitate hydratase